MPCTAPLTAYDLGVKGNGKRNIVFNAAGDSSGIPIQLPCGQCTSCRLERSRQWAARCVHEAQLHKQNCFLTLTYADEHLPRDKSLHKRHYQLFLKKLRRRIGVKIRYFLCGEYGSELNSRRPHFHICLFGYDFPDKILYKQSGEYPLYMSKLLDECWNKGISTIGELNFATAAYTARYVMKKVTGEQAKDHYVYIDDFGEIHELQPEFVAMSLKPGIGKKWYDRYKRDLYPRDEMVINGKKTKPTKFYDRCHENYQPEEIEKVKQFRLAKMGTKSPEEYLDKRLAVKDKCVQARLKQYERNKL